MQFYELRDDYKIGLQIGDPKQRKRTRLEFFKDMKLTYLELLLREEKLYGTSSSSTRLGFNQYTAWYDLEELNRPYIKVYPQMAGLMCRTKLDIPARYLRMPFAAFEIRLPVKQNPLVDDPKYPLRSVLVVEQDAIASKKPAADLLKGTGDRVRTLYLFMDFGESAENDLLPGVRCPIYNFLNLHLSDDQPISQSLEQAILTSQPEEGYVPSKSLLYAAMSLAVSATFFLSRQHEAILPDIHPRFKQRWEKAQRTKDQREIQQIQAGCKKLSHYGWNLKGREIELPAPVYENVESGKSREERGRSFELRFSQLRSGHLRMQPYGPRDNPTHYDVIFIDQTEVRPDLPSRPHSGFVLKDNLRGTHGSVD